VRRSARKYPALWRKPRGRAGLSEPNSSNGIDRGGLSSASPLIPEEYGGLRPAAPPGPPGGGSSDINCLVHCTRQSKGHAHMYIHGHAVCGMAAERAKRHLSCRKSPPASCAPAGLRPSPSHHRSRTRPSEDPRGAGPATTPITFVNRPRRCGPRGRGTLYLMLPGWRAPPPARK